MVLNIIKRTGDSKEKLSLRAVSPKKIESAFLFPVTVHQIFSTINFNEAITSTMTSSLEESELIALGNDIKFRSHLLPLKELFVNNCDKLVEE